MPRQSQTPSRRGRGRRRARLEEEDEDDEAETTGNMNGTTADDDEDAAEHGEEESEPETTMTRRKRKKPRRSNKTATNRTLDVIDEHENDENRGGKSKEERMIDMVHFLLATMTKRGCVRTDEMRKCLQDGPGISGRISNTTRAWIMENADEKLKHIFGLKYIPNEVGLGRGSHGFLVNLMQKDIANKPRNCNDHLELEENDEEPDALLYSVLAFIYMSNNNSEAARETVTADQLWHFLSTFGLNEKRRHPVFGDLKQLISTQVNAEFVNHGWLEMSRATNANGSEVVNYGWGPRARTVVNPMQILEFVSDVMADGDQPKAWKSHYKRATEMRAAQQQELGLVKEEAMDETQQPSTSRGRHRNH